LGWLMLIELTLLCRKRTAAAGWCRQLRRVERQGMSRGDDL